MHTAFYDPVVLKAGESIYVDSNMGHAYVAEGCEEATVLAVCSSAEESLMESLMSLHGDEVPTPRTKSSQPTLRPATPRSPTLRPGKARKSR